MFLRLSQDGLLALSHLLDFLDDILYFLDALFKRLGARGLMITDEAQLRSGRLSKDAVQKT
jgi:hypothetical protein